MVYTTYNLPGISFTTEVPQISEVLPRMDIAAFVGFATSGPMNTPVPIEDIARFREIFGDDVELAWNNESGVMQHGYFGPAVESFFRNGGRRCWVIRVGSRNVHLHSFHLPNLVPIKSGNLVRDKGEYKEAKAIARSPGSWAKSLRISTVLNRINFPHIGPSDTTNSGEGYLFTEVTKGKKRIYKIKVNFAPEELQSGDLLRITLPVGGLILFLFVDNFHQSNGCIIISGSTVFWFLCDQLTTPPLSPMIDDENTSKKIESLDEKDGWALYENLYSISPTPPRPIIELLRFEILVWRRGKLEKRFDDLAFWKNHPRFWANLPSDADLYQHPQGRKLKDYSSEVLILRQQADSPRFDLAGPENEKEGLADYFLPINMHEVVDEKFSNGPDLNSHMSDQEQNGVDHFDDSLFIDENLKYAGRGALLQEANHRYYIRQMPLQGIHSLLPVDEVTMVAVPDAIHSAWSLDAESVSDQLEAPILEEIPKPDKYERYTLTWSEVPGATGYLVQRSDSSDFQEPVNYRVESQIIEEHVQLRPTSEKPETKVTIRLPYKCSRYQYFRVRAERLGEISPWSNNRGKILPHLEFIDCKKEYPENLELELLPPVSIGSPKSGYLLKWKKWDDSISRIVSREKYELQMATDMEFLSAQQLYSDDKDYIELPFLKDPMQQSELILPKDTVTYFRVRALSTNTVSPWSNTIRLSPEFVSIPTLQRVENYNNQALLKIHSALIRFCAARGDMIALLSLPRHYRYQDILNYMQALKAKGNSSPLPPNHLDDYELSYGALYHPWLASNIESQRDNDMMPINTIRFIPPDGAISGTFANRTINQGAWIAPANQSLDGILALEPDFTHDQWAILTAGHINIILQDPRGFMVLNADTLSFHKELRLINIRRLLILLRRLALREGNTYVFESNDSDFRDNVQHYFEQVLSDLFVHGAFTGATQDEAYRVVTDSSVNTRQSLDIGRFIVELQVAPSRPLSFINIRLLQTDHNQLEIQEF